MSDTYDAAVREAVHAQLTTRERLLRELFERYALRGLDDWVLVEDVTDPLRVSYRFEHRPIAGTRLAALEAALRALVAESPFCTDMDSNNVCHFCSAMKFWDNPEHEPNCPWLAAKALVEA